MGIFHKMEGALSMITSEELRKTLNTFWFASRSLYWLNHVDALATNPVFHRDNNLGTAYNVVSDYVSFTSFASLIIYR